jgi:small-conductance mechanosensitive channel
VLIPNSYFLNNKIINWNLTDQKIRLKINVGVAYGSDAREVEKLLLKAADDHSRVLKKPEPYVVFRDFGPNALEFSLFFWVDMTNASTVKVPSDLRFRLVSLFEEKNIAVAFPQMDVHLNATEPIEVSMSRPAREALQSRQEENQRGIP